MKKYITLLSVAFLFIFLMACSSKASLELVNTNVEFIEHGGIGITQGDKKGEFLVPTALYYEFTIKNNGWTKIDGRGENGMEIKIEPSDRLVASSREIFGFNVFNPSEDNVIGLGHGQTLQLPLLPNQTHEFTLDYLLGVSEENPQIPILPPTEDLEKFYQHVLDGTLIVLVNDKEIARLDLNNG